MSGKKKPTQDTHQVGYGRPPVHSRFPKGRSGNPSGKRSQGEAERAKALMRKEAYRRLPVREGEKVRRMEALQAVVRSQYACALKGNVAAQRAIINDIREVEGEAQEARTAGLAHKQPYKNMNDLTDEELMDILRAAETNRNPEVAV